MWLNHVPIQILHQNFRFTAFSRNDCERVHGVFDLFRIAAVNIRDPFAVRTPGRRAFQIGMRIGFRRSRDPPFLCARLRTDDINVPILGAVGIVPALRQKSDLMSVWRPGRQNVVVFARS